MTAGGIQASMIRFMRSHGMLCRWLRRCSDFSHICFPGSVSGSCFAVPHSPWPPLLAPSPPRPVSRLCSATSQLLQRDPTSPLRASLACGFRLPNAAPTPGGKGEGETSRFPCKKCRRVPGVSDHAEPVCRLAMASATVLPSRFTHPVGARKSAFAAQYPAHDSPPLTLTVSGAWHGAGTQGYAFTVWNLHPLLLVGLSGARAIA
jgi:hypothetical protein